MLDGVITGGMGPAIEPEHTLVVEGEDLGLAAATDRLRDDAGRVISTRGEQGRVRHGDRDAAAGGAAEAAERE